MKTFDKLKTVDEDNEVTYTPYISDDGRVGYVVRDADGASHYVYLNPSTGGDPPANIFVYAGEANDPNDDSPLCYV